jgi:hypothetical protein
MQSKCEALSLSSSTKQQQQNRTTQERGPTGNQSRWHPDLEMGEDEFLLFKPHSLGYFVADLEDEDRVTD